MTSRRHVVTILTQRMTAIDFIDLLIKINQDRLRRLDQTESDGFL